MPAFALTTPKYGVGEHVPSRLLSQAFLSKDSRNVREFQGDYRAVRGRLHGFYDAHYQPIAAPVFVATIISLNQETKTLTVAGNHAAAIQAAVVDDQIRINGSTANDGLYTFISATDDGDNTKIVVQENLPSATANGNVFVGRTKILAYHRYVKDSTGAEYLLVATAYHILLWNDPARTFTVKFTCSMPASVRRWSIVTHLDRVYATNNVDKVLRWDSAGSIGNVFEPLGDTSGILVGTETYLTAAKCLFSYQGYLWLGGTTENATPFPRRVRYSDANADTFNVDGAGDAGAKDFDDVCGFVTAFASIQSYVIIACEERMTRAWLTETEIPWYFQMETVRAGCRTPHTLVNDREGRLYWLASDLTIRELETGAPITTPHAAKTIRDLNTEYIEGACAAYYEQMNRLLFAVPTSQSTHNDMVIEVDPASYAVVYHDIAVCTFGHYSRQATYMWDTLPYDTWDQWGAAWLVWDATANIVGFPLILVADYDGYGYEFDQSDRDAGQPFEHRLVFEAGLIEPDKYLPLFKRVNEGIDLFFQRHEKTRIDVYIKTDGGPDWKKIGSSDLRGDGRERETVSIHFDADLRARHFAFQIVADGYFEFVGLYVNNVTLDGLR